MKKTEKGICIFVVFICFLTTVNAFFFFNSNSSYLKIYLIFLVVIWFLTLGFWPWWNTKDKKRRRKIRVANEEAPDYLQEDNITLNMEIKKNPQAKEIPYQTK